jgi:hypothetical protein
MTARTIEIEGIELLRSKDAARIVGLASDYISRMARAGEIDGRLVGNLWFVNLASLKSFIASTQIFCLLAVQCG